MKILAPLVSGLNFSSQKTSFDEALFFCAQLGMNFENPIALILGAFFLCVVGLMVASNFSAEAKLERRRRKSNARIVRKSGRETVKFSVKTGKSR